MAEIRATYEGGHPGESNAASGTLVHVEGLFRFQGTHPAPKDLFGVTKVRFLIEPETVRAATLTGVGAMPGRGRLHILCDDDADQWTCRFELGVSDGGHLLDDVQQSRGARGEGPLPTIEGLVDRPEGRDVAALAEREATVLEDIRAQLRRIADALEQRPLR